MAPRSVKVNLLGGDDASTRATPRHAPGSAGWLIDRSNELRKKGWRLEAADLLLEAARGYAADEFWLKALSLFRQALELDPDRTAIQGEVAFLMHRLGNPADARQAEDAFRAGCARIPALRPQGEQLRYRDMVVAAPDDLRLRLVLADGLLERGEPQGEAIQLEQRDPQSPRLTSLRQQHQGKWLGELRPLLLSWELRHTLVEAATLTADVYLEHRDVLFAAAPLRRVHLLERDDDPDVPLFETALEGPHRLRITGLIRQGSNHYYWHLLPRLLALAQRAAHLTHLALPSCHLDAAAMFQLLRAFPRLKELDLRQNPVTGVVEPPAAVRL